MVFPLETGRPLKPYFITAEAARNSIAAAELAQKSGKKPVIYTGTEQVAPAAPATAERPRAEPKSKTPIVVQRDAAGGKCYILTIIAFPCDMHYFYFVEGTLC